MFEIHPVKKVSVVIPVYNEQESLPELIRRTTTACESLGKEYEILLIDDGSSDNSAHMPGRSLTSGEQPYCVYFA
ncbi:undecaprenyl phosphate 4-deoxy-4-formamido-L-arabinose transferase [Escherichia coli]|uniref:Undecaprenyl phosphate 4-deoxy-4-formamido-L-arabinose transferase n=1 Tax=Escherichia coli TaxID=562 RepID=A0A377DQW7_ECOLX|nr:undecaprenyl phosphate 4-deoxy-4-formamido-L-arabinose transferase [Escherichia coli]